MRLCSSIGACRCLWVHVVAERIGDDPAVLLRNDAARKHQQKANTDFSAQISALAAGFLGK
jgi:integrase